jgi:MFS family permease
VSDSHKATGLQGVSPQAWLTVGLFLLCSTCSFVDRQVISLLVEPLKSELALTDLQIGLLQGFAFATCYAVMGIPLARALDRSDRVRIASACVGVWSLATAACAFVAGYGTLLAARAMTAVAEAGLPPAALSLIGDRFPRSRIGQASAIFMLGPYLGTGLALIGGGLLLGSFQHTGGIALPGGHVLTPWRSVFLVVAAPGFLLAPLLLVLRDPRNPARAERGAEQARLGLLRALDDRRSFLVPYLAGAMFAVLVLFAQTAWLPTYFIRVRGIPAPEVGRMTGLLYLGAGMVGSLAASLLSGRGAADPLVRILALMRWAALVLAASACATTLVTSAGLSLALFATSVVASSLIVALIATPLQLISPSHVRAQIITVGGFVIAVGSAGGGPFVVGLLTDRLFGRPEAIGDALALTSFAAAAAGAVLLHAASRRIPG